MTTTLDVMLAARDQIHLLRDALGTTTYPVIDEVQAELAWHARMMCRRGLSVTSWQQALNDLTGATQHHPGALTLSSVRCGTCHGRRFETRHPSLNLTRTGSPVMCGECRGTGRARVTA